MKLDKAGASVIAVMGLLALGGLVQVFNSGAPAAAEPAFAAPPAVGTPGPPDEYLPYIAKQPTLTPTPTQTPTKTPTPTSTPTPQPTVITSAEYCRGPFLEIPEDSTSSMSDTISIPASGTIVDLDVYINTAHTWVGDLRFSLEHVGVGPTRILIDRPGEPPGLGCSGDNISAVLDDDAILPVEGQCSASVPTISGVFFPNQTLSAFNNQNINGSWTLEVEDVIVGDGGTFNGWCMLVDFSTSP